MVKYYSEKDNEGCVWPLSEYQDRILNGESEIILLEMKRGIGGEMFCKEEFDFVGYYDCGSWCPSYAPCNGVSGRCRFLVNGFTGTGRKFKLTAKKLEVIT